jgi:predicted nucleic-acid-binding protein
MSALALEQKTNPNLTKLKVEQTLSSEEKLKREIEQFINEDNQGSKGIPFRIIITAVIWVIIFGAVWLAWL